jgi:small nuclear ribonucleoprotein F
MSFVPVNPRPMLQGLVDKDIVVRLKWGETEYKGKLVSLDSYLNLQLAGTVEYINGKATGELGQVLIRCGIAPSAVGIPGSRWRLTWCAAGATMSCGYAVPTKERAQIPRWRIRSMDRYPTARRNERRCPCEF